MGVLGYSSVLNIDQGVMGSNTLAYKPPAQNTVILLIFLLVLLRDSKIHFFIPANEKWNGGIQGYVIRIFELRHWILNPGCCGRIHKLP